jgi:4-amino-4-deoxy-L-arabinose transferase-like glycosyltransferase
MSSYSQLGINMNFKSIIKNRNFQLILIFILIGSAFRVFQLSAGSIRGDEGGAIFVAGDTVSHYWDSISGDVHPPLYYLLLNVWIKIGGISKFFLRLLPCLFSIATIPIVFLLGKKLFNDKIGLMSSFIFAMSQANIRYAQTLKQYSILTFFVTLSLYYFISYLDTPSKKTGAFWIGLSAICMYLHYYSFLIILAEFIFLLVFYKKYKQIFLRTFLLFILVGVLVLPLVPMFYGQMSIKTNIEQEALASEPLHDLGFGLNINNIFVRVGLMFYHLSAGYLKVNFSSPFFILLFALICCTFFITFSSVLKKIKDSRASFLCILISVPTLIFSFLWFFKIISPHIYARFILFISPLLYILISVGIVLFSKRFDKFSKIFSPRNIILLFVILILLFNSVSLYSYYNERPDWENWEAVSESIVDDEDSIILIYPAVYVFNLDYSYTGDSKYYLLPGVVPNSELISFKDYTDEGMKPLNDCSFLNKIPSNVDKISVILHRDALDNQDVSPFKECLSDELTFVSDTSSSFMSHGEKITDLFVLTYSTT